MRTIDLVQFTDNDDPVHRRIIELDARLMIDKCTSPIQNEKWYIIMNLARNKYSLSMHIGHLGLDHSILNNSQQR